MRRKKSKPNWQQIGNRRVRISLVKDRLHSTSLVAVDVQFDTSFELQQIQLVGPHQGLEEYSRVERPEMIATRVLPCRWICVNLSRTPAHGLA